MSEAKPGVDLLTRILEGQAPRQLRAAAARGALPLPRVALVQLYVMLGEDDDEEIRRDAENSLAGLENDAVIEVLGDGECSPEVLQHFAPLAVKNERMAERIAFHPSVPTMALTALAARGSPEVIELVLTNQERLLLQPNLLNVLSLNPALRADQRGRILELLDRATRGAAAGADSAESEAGDGSVGEITEELEEAARLLQLDIGELYAASEILGAEEFEETDDVVLRSAYKRILELNVAQKAILAMRGGREERMILIRDTNKLVALGVLRNPRMVIGDIESIARMRCVSDEVLRKVGQTREWTKKYDVMLALVQNPRTPQGISTNHISRLQTKDLRKLVASKEVPELIRRMAKRTVDVRTSRQKGRL